MLRARRTVLRELLTIALLHIPLGCAAVYPELETRTSAVPAGVELDPPPPEHMRWVRFVSAEVPNKTRDGREWDQVFGSLPDPYAVLFVGDKEVLRSPTATDTLEPVWADGESGNIELNADDRVRIELWDKNQLNDQPIGVRDLGKPRREWDDAGEIRVDFSAGGRVIMAWEPAHAVYGLGLWYELRNDGCAVTRLLDNSPASRAGLQKGDDMVRINGRDASLMSTDEIRSAFNAIPAKGLPVVVVHKDGTTADVLLVEGPIYPPFARNKKLK